MCHEYFEYVCMCLPCSCPVVKEPEDIRSPGPGIKDSWEPRCGCWDSGLLREQPVLLMTEPSSLTLETVLIFMSPYTCHLLYDESTLWI